MVFKQPRTGLPTVGHRRVLGSVLSIALRLGLLVYPVLMDVLGGASQASDALCDRLLPQLAEQQVSVFQQSLLNFTRRGKIDSCFPMNFLTWTQ